MNFLRTWGKSAAYEGCVSKPPMAINSYIKGAKYISEDKPTIYAWPASQNVAVLKNNLMNS
jgi:hypothetical protein